MKSKLLIITLLIASLIGAFTLKTNAQTTPPTLLADETTISYSGNLCKIETDNGDVFCTIYRRWNQLFRHYTCRWRKDKSGRHPHYAIYLSKGDSELIVKWAKTSL